jgi:hypothetical protein
MTNKEKVFHLIKQCSPKRLTNNDILAGTRMKPHQQVYQKTRELLAEGRIKGRQVGATWEYWYEASGSA